MTTATHAPNKHPESLTAARKSKYLEILRRTGNQCLAAKEASPHLRDSPSKYPALSTFKSWEAVDPVFRAQVAEAKEEACALIVEEIRRRGHDGYLEPVYQGGKRVTDLDPETGEEVPATIRRYDSRLLVQYAKALMPHTFGDKREVTVQHKADPSRIDGWRITANDLAILSLEHKSQLADILGALRRHKGEVVTPTDHQLDVIDVESEEVEEHG